MNKFTFLLILLLANTSVQADSTNPIHTFQGHTDSVRTVAFSPDRATALSSSSDNTIKLWDIQSGEEIRTLNGHSDKVYSASFSPDGNTVLSGSRDNTLKLWDIHSGQLIRTFRGHTNSVRTVAFLPDGNTALSGSEDNTIKLWEISTGKLLSSQNQPRAIYAIAISPDGNRVLSGSQNGTIKLWDIKTGQQLVTFKEHTGLVSSIAFSPDGNTAISGSYDKTIKLWNLKTGQEILTFRGHTDKVYSVIFTDDGRYAISASQDNTIKVWNIETGKKMDSFQGHTDWVYSVAFDSVTRTALSGSRDQTLKLWKVYLPPTAALTVSPNTGTAPLTVTLDASQSEGDILNYQWSTSDGNSLIGQKADLTFENGGTYTITLTVTDDFNQTATLEKDIVINQAPKAILTLSPESGEVPLTINLDGSASVDTDGTIENYQWFSSDGHQAAGNKAQMTFQKEGQYIITLVVSDNSEASTEATKIVTVGPNRPPIAAFTASPGEEGKKPLTLHLDASQSDDPDGHLVSWQWLSSSGKLLTGEQTDLILTTVGEQTITLTVTDNEGATATTEKTITVTGNAPDAKLSVSPLTGKAPLTVQLDGSDSIDSDGQITDYHWMISNGQPIYGRTGTVTFNHSGTYQIDLVVTDNDGLSSNKATQTVTVEEQILPVVKLQASPLSGVAPLTIALNGSHSFVPNGGYLTDYYWSATDTKTTLTASGKTTTLTFDQPGNYTLTLTVTDENNHKASDNVTITVTDSSQIAFEGLQESYEVGDIALVDLIEIVPRNPLEMIDLWVAIQIPSGEMLFITDSPQEQFDPKPQPYKKSLPNTDTANQVLEFKITPDMGGDYTLYGLYVKEGESPIEQFENLQSIQRSNLATQSTFVNE